MRVVLSLILAVSATAFTPAALTAKTAKTAALNAIPVEKEVGAQAPIGFFDPLGFIKNGPYGSPEENFRHYRTVEVKHCRVAMAATVGTLVQETNHFSGFLSTSENLKFEDVPNGLGALSAVPLAGWVQIIGVLGLHEILIRQRAGKAPGNYGTGYLGLKMDDQSSAQLRALSIEISNGRLAMLGILGMWASEIVNGQVLAEVKGFGL